MCSERPYRSTDMQHHFLRSDHDLDLRLTFKNDPGQIIVHSTRLKKRNTMLAKWMSCLCWVISYYSKTVFSAKNGYFEFLLSGGQIGDPRANLRTYWRKSVKRAIEWVFPGRCSSSGCRVMCRFEEKCWKCKIWPLVNDLWPDQKMTKVFPSLFFTLFWLPLTACRYGDQEPS